MRVPLAVNINCAGKSEMTLGNASWGPWPERAVLSILTGYKDMVPRLHLRRGSATTVPWVRWIGSRDPAPMWFFRFINRS